MVDHLLWLLYMYKDCTEYSVDDYAVYFDCAWGSLSFCLDGVSMRWILIIASVLTRYCILSCYQQHGSLTIRNRRT